MKRFLSIVLLVALCVYCLPAKSAETLPAPFLGYFEGASYIRSTPKVEKTSLGVIPPQTAVFMTPVNEKYAAIEYEGVKGYLYYPSAKNMPKETEISPRLIFSEGNKFLLDSPLSGAKQLAVIDRESPITLTAEVGGYYHVSFGDLGGYIRQTDTKALPKDVAVIPYDVFVRQDTAVHALPLLNAEVVYTLHPFQVYQVLARCRGYLKISWGTQEGYVAAAAAQKFTADQQTLRVAVLTNEIPVYQKPDLTFIKENAGMESGLYFLDAVSNGFYRVADSGLYVFSQDVMTWAVDTISTCQIYSEAETKLLRAPQEDAQALSQTLAADGLCAVSYVVGDYCLVKSGSEWGFVPKSAVQTLLAGETMNRTAAVTTKNTRLFTFDGGEKMNLQAGEKLFLTRFAENFYVCEAGDRAGYVRAQDVRLVGSDAPLDSYRVTLNQPLSVMDFPDLALSAIKGEIPAGTVVTVSAFNRCYLLVSAGEVSGYAKQDGLLSAETRGMQSTEDAPRYELVLDKSTRMAYAFVLNEQGERTEEIAISARVAIGKRTTPTPSGTFTLGKKERWHRFTHSYTPHTTTYVSGRYIHGLPCTGKSNATVIDYLAHNAGQAVTGGCLRSPFEFARFVYLNCPSYQTTLTIVSGGLIVPGTAEETPVPEETPAPNASPLPDEGGEPDADEPEADG